jgi:hypothetical protein
MWGRLCGPEYLNSVGNREIPRAQGGPAHGEETSIFPDLPVTYRTLIPLSKSGCRGRKFSPRSSNALAALHFAELIYFPFYRHGLSAPLIFANDTPTLARSRYTVDIFCYLSRRKRSLYVITLQPSGSLLIPGLHKWLDDIQSSLRNK